MQDVVVNAQVHQQARGQRAVQREGNALLPMEAGPGRLPTRTASSDLGLAQGADPLLEAVIERGTESANYSLLREVTSPMATSSNFDQFSARQVRADAEPRRCAALEPHGALLPLLSVPSLHVS